MAFRASNLVPHEAYRIVKQAAVALKTNLQRINLELAGSNADYETLRGIYRLMERASEQFSSLSTTAGLAEYARSQENDGTYDVAAEFAAMQSAITAALSWMDANIPTSVTVGPPSTWGDGTMVINEFTPAQTGGLRSKIAAVIATID